VTGDLVALAKGRPVVLRASGRITITGVPVPAAPRDAARVPAADVRYYAHAGMAEEPFPAHLVIESLPAGAAAGEVAQAIASRAARPWPDPDPGPAGPAALPVSQVDDQSEGAEVRIVLTLCPGADPAAVRDQLATIEGVSAEVPCAFAAPLAGLLRSWVNDHRGEDITASLTEFEDAVHGDRQHATRNRR
jgi:hypothetical protein